MSLLGNFYGARAYAFHVKGGDEKEALVLYKKAEEAGLTKIRTLLAYSVLLLRNGKYDEAIALCRRVDKMPNLLPNEKRQIRTNYALAQWKKGKLDYGIELLQELHRQRATSIVYGALGYMLIEKGDAQQALAYSTEALEYDDEDPVVLDNMGQIYYRMLQDTKTAQTYFEKALQFKENQTDSLYYLAKIKYDAGEHEAARKLLEKAKTERISSLSTISREDIITLLDSIPA